MSDEPVYEMLWDCKFCGQKKLLGLTHRFCAGCGGPQDPTARYFPPENEKVAVLDHPFVGADVACPACRQPMSRAAKCCTHCGSPIDKGVEVARRADVVVGPGGGPPLAMVVDGDVTITGTLDVSGDLTESGPGTRSTSTTCDGSSPATVANNSGEPASLQAVARSAIESALGDTAAAQAYADRLREQFPESDESSRSPEAPPS